MPTFWNFKNTAEPNVDELHINGDIVDDDDVWLYDWFSIPCAAPNQLRLELKKRAGKSLNVWVNSYGGSVFAGAGIYNALKAHNGRVTTIVDGIAASAASVIAMAGDSVEITPVGMLMIHNPMGCMGTYSEAKDFRHMADMLDKVKDTIATAYVLKTNMSREEINGMMDDESYMTAGEAVRLGFADAIHGVDAAQASIINTVFRRGKKIDTDDKRTLDAVKRIAAKIGVNAATEAQAQAETRIDARQNSEIAAEAAKLALDNAAAEAAKLAADTAVAEAAAQALNEARVRLMLRTRLTGVQ